MDAEDVVSFLYFLPKKIDKLNTKSKQNWSQLDTLGDNFTLAQGKARQRDTVAAFAELSLVELNIYFFSIQLSKHFNEYLGIWSIKR